MSGTITEKELRQFLKAISNGKEKHKMLRYHIYATIDQYPEDSSNLDDVLQSVQGYGHAEVFHVEVIDDENG